MKREICCRQCFAYVSVNSRKCKFCGFKLKSTGKYLLEKIKKAFYINRVYTVGKNKKFSEKSNLFTREEINYLLKMEDLNILMYMILDDLSFLDETSLIELGETISSSNYERPQARILAQNNL